jgi:hypothetical protein
MTLAEITDKVESLTKQILAVCASLTRDRERSVILNDELWNWAQYRAKQLGKESVSQYLFDLLREEKKKAKT